MKFQIHKFDSGKTARTHRPLDDTLISICLDKSPKQYLEIGTREGGSLVAVLQHSNPHPELVVMCDTWGNTAGGTGRGDHSHIQKLLNELDYKGEIIWLDGSSLDLIPSLQQTFDFILVDGAASVASKDLENSWPLLDNLGLLVMDDSKRKGIMNFCKQWEKERNDVEFIHVDERTSGNLVLQKKGKI